jgi:hypothetical protein
MILEKRNDLERFIREQTIGPGGTGYRFFDLNASESWPENLSSPLGYNNELINVIPAGIYSTGILFPVDDSKKANGPMSARTEMSIDSADSGIVGLENEDNYEEEDDNDADIDSQSLNQMYPNTMGLTVCFQNGVLSNPDFEISITGRHYTKLKEELLGIGLLIELRPEIVTTFFEQLPDNDKIKAQFKIENIKERHILRFLGDPKDISLIKKRVREMMKEQLIVLKGTDTRSYKSFEGFKSGLFNELKRNILPNSKEGAEIVDKLKKIETFENIMSHILDALAIHDGKEYGIWKCESFKKVIDTTNLLPKEFSGKIIHNYNRIAALKDLYRNNYGKNKWSSLSVNLQFSKDTRNTDDGRVFMKVQLLNTSKHYSEEDTKEGKNYFSLASEEVNKRCFFGVGITVSSHLLIPYRDRKITKKGKYDEDEISQYIYRQFKDYGIGHGCSVTWGKENKQLFVATEYIPTHETPDVDPIPRQRTAPKNIGTGQPEAFFPDAKFLQFKWLSSLSNTSDQELIQGLHLFVNKYKEWIKEQNDPDNPEISSQIKDGCNRDQERVSKNIDLLLSGINNADKLLSFRLMNSAMFMQLWHSEKSKKDEVATFISEKGFSGFTEIFYKEKANDNLFSINEPASWRPFQLAFILLNLDGIFQRGDDPNWDARNEWVDLVWFPTGGGKTEAYLGLIALTIINRRRTKKNSGGGTAVLMRYTLRLLTTQQFQRATLLIMALELMRRWQLYDLGDNEPIYIGLFVGQGSLPNKLRSSGSDDKKTIELLEEYQKLELAQKESKSVRSKIPLKKCPWCGHDLNPVKFYEQTDRSKVFEYNRIHLGCSRKGGKCSFAIPPIGKRSDQGPISVSLCDEEIYQQPPALLFGTVDKFAQLAHKVNDKPDNGKDDSRRLFGNGNWEAGKPSDGYLPPDLIIQDELHLMMGPLGSAVALFESAVDQLCTYNVDGKVIRPKVISSTATTRNTDLQIMALFDRRVNLFPKPGIDCDDSFFAFYKRRFTNNQGRFEYISKRKYIGILPTGRTQMWMQFRLAAILFTHRAIFESKKLADNFPVDYEAYNKELCEVMDYYHTVLSYFNSLREVGKTQSQIYTYLLKEIRRVFNRVIRPAKLMQCLYTFESSFKEGELTGRLSGEEIINELDRIGTAWQPKDRFAHISMDEISRGTTPPDFVIATNMISVGIDISRFNSIIINCMPRNIAEYIQATSRVARNKEGVVITVHHPFRSRDISHYERFVEFHEKMYSYVEPISITPFTKKALERYLPLYIATIVRHRGGFPQRTSANTSLVGAKRIELVDKLITYFKVRHAHLKSLDVENTIKKLLEDENLVQIDRLVNEAIDAWNEEFIKASENNQSLVFNYNRAKQRQLYVDINEYQDNIHSSLWRIPQSLRVVDPEAVIHINQK